MTTVNNIVSARVSSSGVAPLRCMRGTELSWEIGGAAVSGLADMTLGWWNT